jgi:bifunctional UDP-N-acetylglucosamine pyrophosphorylase/glucosamine-1-phosphate N-acetyltransferase
MSEIKNMKNIYAVVLAAGKGKRMNSHLPKVLHKILDQPMIAYTLATLKKLKIPIVVVIGHKADHVKKFLGNSYFYAEQKELLGTGDAVRTAVAALPKDAKNILVLNGDDSAFYRSKTLQKLIHSHLKNKNDITILYSKMSSPSSFGRVIFNGGKVKKIIEEKDADRKEKKIKEINTGTYCFNLNFLRKKINALTKNPSKGEYYLTQLIEIGNRSGAKISGIKLDDPEEWFGVNTKEQLLVAKKLMKRYAKKL